MKSIGHIAYLLIALNSLSAQSLSEQVLVVFNRDYTVDENLNGIHDGVEIAEYYQDAREIPAENMLGVHVTSSEEMSREEYDAFYDVGSSYAIHLKQSIEQYLDETLDPTGRKLKDKIFYIALVKGVPLKIKSFGAGADVNTADYSSVDAELSLLFQELPIAGRLNNPYFNVDPNNTKTKPFKSFQYKNAQLTLSYLVTRLDAYTTQEAKGMIDRAVAADPSSQSTFVLDDHKKSYDYMFNAYYGLKFANLSMYPNPWSDTQTWITTLPGKVMGYISHGTYAGMPSNYVTSTLKFQWAKGALFTSYESYNARSFRSKSPHGQVADFIKAGGTAGIGYVYEPWTSGMVREEILFPMYGIGYTLAEAAYMSMQYLSWTATVAGDPLCRVSTAPSQIAASMGVDRVTGHAPLTVSFSNLSLAVNTSITSVLWDFTNDGVADASGNSAAHTFDTPGEYVVRLSVSDGTRTDYATVNIIVSIPPRLEAQFQHDVSSGPAPLLVKFQDISIAEGTSVESCSWDFNADGLIDAQGPSAVYTYEKEGSYIVRLTVSDGARQSDATCTINVSRTPIKIDSSVVLFSQTGTHIDRRTRVVSGSIVVNEQGGRLVFGPNSFVSGEYDVKSDSVEIHRRSVVESPIYGNFITGRAANKAYSLDSLPVVADLPFFKESMSTDIGLVINRKSPALDGGAYGAVVVNRRSRLILKGGTYHFESLTLENNSSVECLAPSEILIGGKLVTGRNIFIGPDTLSGLGASAAVVYAGDSVLVGAGGTLRCILFSNAHFQTSPRVRLRGFFSAQSIAIGPNNEVSLDGASGLPESLRKDGGQIAAGADDRRFGLWQNYPNPFNPTTTIVYSISEPGVVSVRVYNMLGQEIKTLVNRHLPAGSHTVVWDARSNSGAAVASGYYICVLASREFKQTRKMLLLK